MCGALILVLAKPSLVTVYRVALIVFVTGLAVDAGLTFFLGSPSRESNQGIAYTMQAYGMLIGVLTPVLIQLAIFLPVAYMSKRIGSRHDLTARLGLSLVAIWGTIHIFAGSTWIWGPH